MLKNWEDRSIITANLLNPAFCGEILRRTIENYNNNKLKVEFPFSLACLILPIVLHKKTRDFMPLRSSTYFHSWVEQNEHLFIDFPLRVRQILPFTRESLMFLLKHKAIIINETGHIEVNPYRKINPKGEDIEEVIEIFHKAELLGKWLSLTGNAQTIFMFLKIRP